MPSRIVIALLIAVAAMTGGFVFVASTRRAVDDSIRGTLRAMKAAGALSPEMQNADLETIPLDNMNLTIPSKFHWRIVVSDILQSFWWIWMTLVLVTCLLIAALCGRKSSPSEILPGRQSPAS